MDREKLKKVLQIVSVMFLIFLVLLYIPVLSSVWADRNYRQGSPWPTIFNVSGIVFAVVIFIGWVIFWNKKR